MNLIKTICLAGAILSASQAFAQSDISGAWHGDLTLSPAARLRIVFHIDKNADIKVKMDSPDQGAKDIPGQLNYVSPDSVSLSFSALGADYSGRLKDGTIEGVFRQSGYSFPLELTPGDFEMKRPQNPVPPFPYSTEEIRIENPDAENVILAGTLTIPSGATKKTPLAILVSGSGQQNRDEEMMGHKPFAVIADALAHNGIATFRYDDRGVAESTGDASRSTTADNAADAAAVLKNLLSSGRFGKTGIIGHSEGAQIAFRLAADGKTAPDFIVGLCTPAVRGDSILIDQTGIMLRQSGVPEEWISGHLDALAKVYEALIKGDRAAAEKIAAERVKNTESIPPLKSLSESLSQIAEMDNPWLTYFFSYSPGADIAAVSCPAFAIYGSKDTQVTPSLNMRRLEQLNPGVKVKCYPGLNHLFQHASTGMANEYSSIEETISPEVLSDISDFINSQTGR